MALSDYYQGPGHKRQAQDLERQLTALQERYGHLQTLARKYGALEVLDVQRLVEQVRRPRARGMADQSNSTHKAEQDRA